MPAPYIPKYEYSIDEWVTHFDHLFHSPEESSSEGLRRYFHAQYPLGFEGCWKMNRCSAALSYLLRHLAEFEAFVVVHERRALVSKPIVVALWRYYGRIPDEHLRSEPDAEILLGFAREWAGPGKFPPNTR